MRDASTIPMHCSKCGAEYDAAPANPQPRSCKCGAPFVGSVTLGEDAIYVHRPSTYKEKPEA